MADLVIRGMEMPKGDNTLSITIFSNGKVSLAHDKKYAEYAGAVLLPEGHGRLTDADELFDIMRFHRDHADMYFQKVWIFETNAYDQNMPIYKGNVQGAREEGDLVWDYLPCEVENYA